MVSLKVIGLLTPAIAGVNAQLNFPFPKNPHLEPFNISVNHKFIDETLQKARLYRPSIGLHDIADWEDGAPVSEVNELAHHWVTEYDWFSVQDEINANFSHYATTVDGSRQYKHPISLHFVHEPSPREDAIPLLLLHGWPSTHLEWSDVIRPLTHPDPSAPAFHVVAPDIPGFGFSPAPQFPGLGPRETGDAVDALMKQLGYDNYGVCSTDLGWWVALWMAQDHGDSLVGHFADFWFATPNATDEARFAAGETTPEETRFIKAAHAYVNKNAGYADIHRTRPLSLAFGMTDSPVGFTAWMWQLMTAVSDGYDYSYDRLITSAMMLWIQGVYGNIRAYKEFQKPSASMFPTTNVPTGVTAFGNDGSPFPGLRKSPFTPKSWVKRLAPNLKFWKRHESGGHFPAFSSPDAWVDDVQTFFSMLE